MGFQDRTSYQWAAVDGGIVAADDAKVIDIVQKTWRKMSPQARQAASELKLPAGIAKLVKEAVE